MDLGSDVAGAQGALHARMMPVTEMAYAVDSSLSNVTTHGASVPRFPSWALLRYVTTGLAYDVDGVTGDVSGACKHRAHASKIL